MWEPFNNDSDGGIILVDIGSNYVMNDGRPVGADGESLRDLSRKRDSIAHWLGYRLSTLTEQREIILKNALRGMRSPFDMTALDELTRLKLIDEDYPQSCYNYGTLMYYAGNTNEQVSRYLNVLNFVVVRDGAKEAYAGYFSNTSMRARDGSFCPKVPGWYVARVNLLFGWSKDTGDEPLWDTVSSGDRMFVGAEILAAFASLRGVRAAFDELGRNDYTSCWLASMMLNSDPELSLLLQWNYAESHFMFYQLPISGYRMTKDIYPCLNGMPTKAELLEAPKTSFVLAA